MIRATAPGKLMLIGEYAVLEGAPALVAAVDRRVEVTLGEAQGPEPATTLTITTDLPGEDRVTLDIGAAPHRERPSRGACFVRDVVGAVLGDEREAEPLASLGSIDVASAALRTAPGGTKLGLGSSAAVAAALTAGVLAWTAPDAPLDPDRLVERARAAHRAAVGGSGSGVDVAASVLGGVHAFRLTPTGLEREALALPEGVRVVPVWTGEPADTAAFLTGVRAFAKADPDAYAARMDGLAEVAERAVEACRTRDAAAFLDAAEVYGRGMRDLGEQAELPIASEAHQRVTEIAAACGAVAKPSGAGGGDIAVVFARADADLQDLDARLEREGFPPVRAPITSVGADVKTHTRLPS